MILVDLYLMAIVIILFTLIFFISFFRREPKPKKRSRRIPHEANFPQDCSDQYNEESYLSGYRKAAETESYKKILNYKEEKTC